MASLDRLRRHRRFPFDGKVQLLWEELGEARHVMANCLDISQEGLRVIMMPSIARATFLHFQIPSLNFGGTGSVRSCARHRMLHEVGIEFLGGLKWDPVRHPIPAAAAAS